MTSFPSLDGFGPTRATLRTYAQAINALARAHAVPRPHWWHTSLKVTPLGLASAPLPLPAGGAAAFQMNLDEHQIELSVDGNVRHAFPMTVGWSGTEMGNALIQAVAMLGLHGDYERSRFESAEPGQYVPEVVQRFFTALTIADHVFERHQASLSGDKGPVQLWPHNFDLSAEWYSTKRVPYEEDGETSQLPAQLNLGFYPGESDADSYFYSSPWPFQADRLESQSLPEGVIWHTEGWQGAQLPYVLLRDDADAPKRLSEFAHTIFSIAYPTLVD